VNVYVRLFPAQILAFWHGTLSPRTAVHSRTGSGLPHKTVCIARFRKDAALRAYLAPEQRDGVRKYGDRLPTPDEMRRDDSIPRRSGDFLVSRQKRALRYKLIDT